jgi:transposase
MTVEPQPNVFVGIDWGTRAHEVCALNAQTLALSRLNVPNTTAGLESLIRWLSDQVGGNLSRLAVALERPDGRVVEALLDREIPTYTLNPKQLDRFRDRFSPAGAKDDRRDAHVLADAMRTDRRAFRRVLPDPPDLVLLRGLVRQDDDLRIRETALGNQLREQLGRYYPQMLDLLSDRPDPFLWDLWELAPTPQQALKASRRAVAARLHKHHIRRLDLDTVMRALGEPPPRVSAATGQAATQAIRMLLPQMRLAHAQRAECGRQIDLLLKAQEAPHGGNKDQHPDAAILRSLPGVGRVVLARMLTEGAEAIRLRDLSRLRALGGSAPVTKRSGKSRSVQMRRACSARLRFAFYHWARIAIQRDPRSSAHYRELRTRGQTHGRALRGVVDRLLAVAVAMLRAGTLYDPARRPVGAAGRSGAARPALDPSTMTT